VLFIHTVIHEMRRKKYEEEMKIYKLHQLIPHHFYRSLSLPQLECWNVMTTISVCRHECELLKKREKISSRSQRIYARHSSLNFVTFSGISSFLSPSLPPFPPIWQWGLLHWLTLPLWGFWASHVWCTSI
jgi:hypothetical protein